MLLAGYQVYGNSKLPIVVVELLQTCYSLA